MREIVEGKSDWLTREGTASYQRGKERSAMERKNDHLLMMERAASY
jgi:hypothetical protein